MNNENLKETIPYRGHEIEIYYDTNAQSPDEWGNDDAFLVYDHRDFYVKRKGFNPDDIYEAYSEGKTMYDGYWVFPVFAYIHSGVSLQLQRYFDGLAQGHNEFDVSFKGFALVKKQKGWSYRRKKAHTIAQSIVEEWNMYLSGDVYGYDTGNDSCWGFYGSEGLKEAIIQAESAIDGKIQDTIQKHVTRLKTYIKNHVPLYVRQPLSI